MCTIMLVCECVCVYELMCVPGRPLPHQHVAARACHTAGTCVIGDNRTMAIVLSLGEVVGVRVAVCA